MAVWALFNGVNCHKCNEQIRKLRGCDEDVSLKTIEGIQITRCPLVYVTAVDRIYIEAYFQYEKGLLPNPGGWLDQTCKFMIVMTFIGNLFTKYQEEKNNGK